MPSGKTHDAITFLLAAPVFAAAYSATADVKTCVVVTASFLFGGLMFGPDLDTISDQYSRWWIFRPMWFPYRSAFKHRSRWSHGLVFGTMFRVIYFLGVLTLAVYTAFFVTDWIAGGGIPDAGTFLSAWRDLGTAAKAYFGQYVLVAVFAGLWIGAASHTVTDMTVTYVKTGRVTEFL